MNPEKFFEVLNVSSRKRKAKEQAIEDQRQNKWLVFIALGITVAGAIMALVPTIIMITPLYTISWNTLFRDPLFYILLGGVVLTTVGLIFHRKVTPPMDVTETEKLRSRLE